jgi:hypothetical protein
VQYPLAQGWWEKGCSQEEEGSAEAKMALEAAVECCKRSEDRHHTATYVWLQNQTKLSQHLQVFKPAVTIRACGRINSRQKQQQQQQG